MLCTNACLKSVCARPARPRVAALAPVHRQVRVPSAGSEPETMGLEDDDPGVRLEVREGTRGRHLSSFYVVVVGSGGRAPSAAFPAHGGCTSVSPLCPLPCFFFVLFFFPALVCRMAGRGGGEARPAWSRFTAGDDTLLRAGSAPRRLLDKCALGRAAYARSPAQQLFRSARAQK